MNSHLRLREPMQDKAIHVPDMIGSLFSALENKNIMLIVADQERLEDLRRAFTKWHARAVGFWSLKSASKTLSSHKPDLVLFHLSADDDCPWDFMDETARTVPIMVLSETNSASEAVMAFEHGAVDYIRLPADYIKFPANVREVLIRAARAARLTLKTQESTEKKLTAYADLQIDPIDRSIRCVHSGLAVPLSAPEFRSLIILLKSPSKSVERDLFSKLIRPKAGDSGDRGVDVLMSRLRSKLKLINSKVSIRSIRGSGYFLES